MGDASGVVVRDATKLSRICSIASGDMGAVLDAAAMKSGDVVLATRTGLYHLESPATGTQTVVQQPFGAIHFLFYFCFMITVLVTPATFF